jgi:hypothetical protein
VCLERVLKNNMPIKPDTDLTILKYHAKIFPEYTSFVARFNKSEIVRWKFPNEWGASLVTVGYKPAMFTTELISLSYQNNVDGQVMYNEVIKEPIRDVTVSDLVVILSKLCGMKDLKEREKYDYS